MARVADGVARGGAATGLVQAGAATRADPAGLSAVMGRVAARLTLGADGVAATAATLHYAPAWAAAAAVRVATVVAQVGPCFARLKTERRERLVAVFLFLEKILF